MAGTSLALPLEAELLERAGATEELDDAYSHCRRGRGRLVFVSGEAGIGKSALVRHFCARTAGRARILWGSCDGLRTPRPLGPFVDIGAATGGALAEVTSAANKPHAVLEALLAQLGDGGETVMVLEDLHWADEATLDVLRLLGRRVERLRTVVIATYRSDELPPGHPLQITLGDLGTAVSVRRVRLEPLSPAAVAQLAEPFDADPEDLYAKTSGNPFFVTESLASGCTVLPPTVRDAVLARVARLGAEARELLEAVAVVPQRAEVALLEAVAGDRIGALDECLASGIVRGESQAVSFGHELARLVVDDAMNPLRRIALHRLVLDALRGSPTGAYDLARLAHHADAAGDAEAVLEFAPAAATYASDVGAHREAAAQLRRALRFAGTLPAAARADLLERLSFECYLTDQQSEAISALEGALECHRSVGDIRREGLGLCSLSARRWCAGDIPGAEHAATTAVSVLERLPPGPELARAYSTASGFAMNAEKVEPALAWGERAMALLEQFPDRQTLVFQLNNSGTIALLAGRSEGRDQLERSIALAREAGLEDHVGRGYIHLGWVGSRTRQTALIDRLDEGIDYCTERGLDLWRLYLICYRSRSDLDGGRWDAAAKAASFVLGQPDHSSLLRIVALTTLAVVRGRRGDPDPWSLLEEARAMVSPADSLQLLAPVAIASAEAAWLDDRPDRVREASDAALSLAMDLNAQWVIGELAFWRWRAGIDETCPPGAAEPFAVHISSGGGEQAAEGWRRIGCPYEAALALTDSDDVESLRRGHDELRQLGAGPALDRAARRLRSLGIGGMPRGPRSSTRENPAQLTNREVEVLALIRSGIRNADIARHLVLSPRTVDHHVSSILRKLDVKTRGEAAAAATRLGLDSDDGPPPAT